MSDTVPASVIAASLEAPAPSFIVDLGPGADFRVGGAVQAPVVSELGSPPLLVDFLTWQPIPVMAPPTVTGSSGEMPPVVHGGISLIFDHLT